MAIRTILIVDDNSDQRAMLRALLEMEGYDVQTAADGDEAVRLQAIRAADVLITDLFMPKRDGFETLEDFRKRWPSTKIIVISGDTSKVRRDYLENAKLIGVEAAFKKPVDPAALFKVLRDWGRMDAGE